MDRRTQSRACRLCFRLFMKYVFEFDRDTLSNNFNHIPGLPHCSSLRFLGLLRGRATDACWPWGAKWLDVRACSGCLIARRGGEEEDDWRLSWVRHSTRKPVRRRRGAMEVEVPAAAV